MKLSAFVLGIGGLVAAAAGAQAQQALPSGPLEQSQQVFGDVVGANFRVPDQVAAVAAPGASTALGPTLGGVLRTSLEVPGAAFAGILKPFADADAAANPAPAAAPAAAKRSRRHGGRHHKSPAIG